MTCSISPTKMAWTSRGTLFAGTTATIQVTVTSTSYPQGYLQGWVDFNADGDWTDAGEHIISDRVLGTGDYDISFPVPVGANRRKHLCAIPLFVECRAWHRPATHSPVKWKITACWSCRTNRWPTPTAMKCCKTPSTKPLNVLVNDFPSSTRSAGHHGCHAAAAWQRADFRGPTDSAVFTGPRCRQSTRRRVHLHDQRRDGRHVHGRASPCSCVPRS